MDVTQIALEGMQNAQRIVENSGRRLAGVSEPGSGSDTVDLSTEMVGLLNGRNLFATDIRVLQTAGEMTKSAIDMLA